MKLWFSLLLLNFATFQGIESAIEERLKKDFFNIYTHTAIEAREITSGDVKPDQIKYYLFTREKRDNYTQINPSDPIELNNPNAKIVFIIHGWTENRERQWYEDLKNGFLVLDEEYYVVQVDWSEPADQLYTVSSYNTKDVGNYIGDFLVGLHTNYSIPLDNFLLVGHSLGGQVSGFVGKRVIELTGNKLPRIIALDPAGPLFSTRPEEERLNKNDAKVVAVLHTDGGTFGFKSPCGTIDFYPNGGNGQPGCTRIDLLDPSSIADPIMCDHHRSWEFFIEAIFNPEVFVANKCESWAKYKILMCNKNEKATLGDLKSKLQGEFYFSTNKDKPFSKKNNDSSLLAKIPNAGKNIVKLLQN